LLEFDISGAGCSEVQPGLPVEQVITGSVEVGDLRQGDYCLSTADITLKGGQSTAYEAPRATRRRLREYWFRLTGEKGIGWDLGLSLYQRDAGSNDEEHQSAERIDRNSF